MYFTLFRVLKMISSVLPKVPTWTRIHVALQQWMTISGFPWIHADHVRLQIWMKGNEGVRNGYGLGHQLNTWKWVGFLAVSWFIFQISCQDYPQTVGVIRYM